MAVSSSLAGLDARRFCAQYFSGIHAKSQGIPYRRPIARQGLSAHEGTAGMARVLVVDDQAEYCRPLVRLFQLAGHDARSVQAGEEAIKYLRAVDAVDVVLLDIMMPGMDGLEVLRQVRLDPRMASVPVVMFTAVSDPVLERHALQKGANDYLVKGRFNFRELSDRLSRYLS
jgi:CheY-like chemotaxis protein